MTGEMIVVAEKWQKKAHLKFHLTNMIDYSVCNLMHKVQITCINPLITEFFNILLNCISLGILSHSYVVINCSLIVSCMLALLSLKHYNIPNDLLTEGSRADEKGNLSHQIPPWVSCFFAGNLLIRTMRISMDFPHHQYEPPQ